MARTSSTTATTRLATIQTPVNPEDAYNQWFWRHGSTTQIQIDHWYAANANDSPLQATNQALADANAEARQWPD